MPHDILEAIRLGRLTALQKPDGGVRGVVVGDIFRKLVARTVAKQISNRVEVASAPFQYALKTKAGCECVAHFLQTPTDLDPEATVMSLDGVGAHDLISRNAVLEGLLRMEEGDQILPFGEMFLRQPIHIFVGRRDGCHTEHSTRGGRGAKGSPHASVARIGDSTERCLPCKRDRAWESTCSLIWPAQREWTWRMLSSRRSCGPMPASICMSGTEWCRAERC